MIQVLLPIALLTTGVAAGVLVGSLVGPVRMMLALPPNRYVEMHQLLAFRGQPLQPIFFTAAAAADIALSIVAPNTATRVLCAIGAIFAIKVILISRTRSTPLKRFATSMDPNNLPSNWHEIDPRPVWAKWNFIRTLCAVGALLPNVVVVALLI